MMENQRKELNNSAKLGFVTCTLDTSDFERMTVDERKKLHDVIIENCSCFIVLGNDKD